jgi:hypothetical protein
MDRDDSVQEGITLPPVHMSRMIAREEADRAIIQHIDLCQFNRSDVDRRVRALEMGYARLVGFMLGSGALGGAAGAIAAKFF